MRSVQVTRQLNRNSTWNRKKTTLFSGHYLHNRSTLDIGVLGYIGVLYHKEHPPEVWHIPPGTLCIHVRMHVYIPCMYIMYVYINVYMYLEWIRR
jgi:hypothetical protein